MLDNDTNEVYLIDFGTAAILPNGVMNPGDDMYGIHNPFAFAPEAFLKKQYSFNADVCSIAITFSEMAHDHCQRSVWERVQDKENVWEGGFDKASAIARKIATDEPTLPRLDKYGPEFEQLLADMLTYDPAKRPTSAEVLERAKLLK